jgi:RNA ligase
MQLDINKLNKLQEDGLLRSQKHDTLPLTIWNYTNTTQWEGKWNDYTLLCRGLVTDDVGNIVARPLKKFFNFGELVAKNKVPEGGFSVYEKLDGSYIQLFYYKGQWVVSSKGSFISDHAQYAQEIFHSMGAIRTLEEYNNYIFELIHPDTRIVLDYGDKKKLVLLAVINNETGEETEPLEYEEEFEYAQELNLHPSVEVDNWEDLRLSIPNDKEGYVVKFDNGERMKLKGNEYLRLHKIVTEISSRHIWKALKDNEDLKAMVERVPDEWLNWFFKVVGKLYYDYTNVRQQLDRDWDFGVDKHFFYLQVEGRYVPIKSRKETAKYINTCQYPKMMYNKLDGNDYEYMIWDLIEPEHEKGFSI